MQEIQPMAKSKIGTAGAKLLQRRTGAEALEAATKPAPTAHAYQWGAGRNQAGYKVTTIRFHPDHWRWLRTQALSRALKSGAKADASEIVRELVDAAMKTTVVDR